MRIARRRMMMQQGEILPAGYTECEYLESHGTEKINLPFGFYPTDTIDAFFSVTDSIVNDKYVVSPSVWNNNNNRFSMGIHSGCYTGAFGIQTTGYSLLKPSITNDKQAHHWKYENRLFVITDLGISSDKTSIIFGAETANLILFYGYNSPTKSKIYSYHHKKADGREINLIPALDPQGVPCLFDTISSTPLYNAGSGTFGYVVK